MGAHTDPDSARHGVLVALALSVVIGIVVAGWASVIMLLILLMVRT
jgi:hypothetical protein